MSFIKQIHTLLPKYQYEIAEVIPFFQKWVEPKGEEFSRKAMRILSGAGIKKRHTIAPLDILFSQRTLEESNKLYCEKAIELGSKALQETLDRASMDAEEIDCLITVSCTGFMIPAFGAFVINKLNLKKDICHIPITEMGCVAGVSALIYADNYLKAYPGHNVAIISLEFPSNTMQLNDYSWDNIVGAALFADGVSCAILSGSKSDDSKTEIISTKMDHLPNSTHLLGYNLTNNGFKMNLDRYLPDVVGNNFINLTESFMVENNYSIEGIDEFLVHPGGIKILNKIENLLSYLGKDTQISREIMENYGNMSSATIFFILKEYLTRTLPQNKALVLGFGPGFSAHQVLIEAF